MFKRVAKLIAVLVVVSTLMMMVAPAFAAGPIPPKDGKQYVIGMAIVGLQHPFFTEMKKHMEAEAQRQDVKLVVMDATSDVGKQMSQIEDLIQQNVDLMIVVPIDASALVAGIEKANAANIPVVVVDRRVTGGKYICFSSTDNVQVGRNAGNYVATRLGGKGNVVEIEGQHGAGPTLDRGAGFHEVIDQYKDIKVVFKQPGEFNRAKGMEVMENVIQSGTKFDAVFCHNDEMAGGAREALKAHDLTGKVILVGVDAQADAMQAIIDGTQDATNMYPPQSGKEGLIQGMHYLKGEPVQETVWLPSALITKGNIDAYMKITY